MRRVTLLAGLTALSIAVWGFAPQSTFDILIRGGRVLDGAGNPWVRADLGIRGDRIVAIGPNLGTVATLVIDAKDRIVAPGFMDAHSHALEGLTNAQLRDARSLIAQGLTTVIGNPDGGGPVNLAQQRTTIESNGGVGVNVALVIGHATVRRAAMGQDQRREPTAAELEQMKTLVRQAVADGAFGLSSGLFYDPGRFSKTEEVIALAREAGGVYTSHIRDEGDYDVGVLASVDEVIRIAEEAHVRGIVSHMKALGPDNWGKSAQMIEHIDAARARGVEVFADQYPYEASSTSLAAAVLPGIATRTAQEQLLNSAEKQKLLDFAKENIRRRGGPKSIVIASFREEPSAAGKNLEELARAKNSTPELTAIQMILAGSPSIVSFNMSEKDIEAIMKQPWTMGSSDGGISLPGPSLPHPRSNGAFARRLGVYVRERNVISLEQSVRTMTSLTASVFGFTDRGEIRPGAFADIVIFNPARVIDKATYTKPHEIAEGIDWVIVNGQVERKEGEFTGTRGGRVLRKQ